ncbi:MAG: hypothetical protein CMJ50_00180 [Planctomycetaceae bacterium]|nr:hypothetical protein [Planctomycetaceae bacterium]
MAKDLDISVDKQVLLSHTKHMAQHWERGHAVFFHMANRLLDECGYDLVVDAAAPKKFALPEGFDKWNEDKRSTHIRNWVMNDCAALDQHYQVVLSALQIGHTKSQTDKLLPSLGDRVLWYFGAEEIRARGDDYRLANQVIVQVTTQIERYEKLKETKKSPLDWVPVFIDPMQENAKKWRTRFRKLRQRFALTAIERAYPEWLAAKRIDPDLTSSAFAESFNKRQRHIKHHITAGSLRAKDSRENRNSGE